MDRVNIRQRIEREEAERLSPWAALSSRTKGRERPVMPCPLRTDFQRDRDRILHSKAFRRLKFKTQVFLSPEGDHYRTRLTHTLEVAQVARTIARALRLNEDLTEAIALGHDLGHTPFGHIGERTLDELMPGGFRHNEQSRRVVDVLENQGEGLNLTWEVRDGILCHSGAQEPATLEGHVVHLADRIAYLNHDMDDALRGGILHKEDIPRRFYAALGETHGQRINTLILDVVDSSQGKPEIAMSPEMEATMGDLRQFMFQYVYREKWRKAEEERCDYLMRALFHHFLSHPTEMPDEYIIIGYREGAERGVADFLSGMTDRYALRTFQHIFIPGAFPVAGG